MHDGTDEDLYSTEQEIVLFVGSPASGKTYFGKNYLLNRGYVHINRDTLKTPSKCKKATIDALKSGSSVYVDNTNSSVKARNIYTTIAKDLDVPIRCFFFDTPEIVANHLNAFREIFTKGKRKKIPEVAFRTYYKYLEHPDEEEGFSEIRSIRFVPNLEDKDERFKKLFFRYYL
eukprot:TRINITY_DN3586_c0_g1_i3.p1 TRINITY_DN3586_c0_g1~~TRINITY_DN3586_c0_g1_i3.p1  ORF type:complete len:174 (-),score=42.14 TRINITY_DN3586_c0_g1_i3:28-549(-)